MTGEGLGSPMQCGTVGMGTSSLQGAVILKDHGWGTQEGDAQIH